MSGETDKRWAYLIWTVIGVLIITIGTFGFEIGDDSDCNDGEIAKVNGTIWECANETTLSATVGVNVSSIVDKQVAYSNGTHLIGDDKFCYDDVTQSLGIGTCNPSSKLEVRGLGYIETINSTLHIDSYPGFRMNLGFVGRNIGSWDDLMIFAENSPASTKDIYFKSARAIFGDPIYGIVDTTVWKERGSTLYEMCDTSNNCGYILNASYQEPSYIGIWGDHNPYVSIGTSSIYYNVSNMTVGITKNMQSDGNYTNITVTGDYKIDTQWSFSGGANTEYHIALSVNSIISNHCHAERVIGSGADVGSASFTCLLSLSAGDELRLAIENVDSTVDPVIHNLQWNILKVS